MRIVSFEISSMFLNAPVMLIAGIGFVVISATALENYLVRHGNEARADQIQSLVNMVVPVSSIASAIWLILKVIGTFI